MPGNFGIFEYLRRKENFCLNYQRITPLGFTDVGITKFNFNDGIPLLTFLNFFTKFDITFYNFFRLQTVNKFLEQMDDVANQAGQVLVQN